MDDVDGLFYVPTSLWVTSGIEIAVCVLVLLAGLTVLRRGPASVLAALGALLAGGSTALVLVSYRTGRWMLDDRFWELTTYARAIGLAVLALALLVALLRTRRGGPGQHQ